MNETKTAEEKNYIASNGLSDLLYKNMVNRPYSDVFKVLQFLETKPEVLNETFINSVIDYLAKMPYNQVTSFFKELPTVLKERGVDVVKDDQDIPDQPPTKVNAAAKTKEIKQKPQLKKLKPSIKTEEIIEAEVSFDDQLGDLDSLI